MSDAEIVDRFMQEGRIIVMPTKAAKRRLVLDVVVSDRFEVGQMYGEVELNEILKQVHPDHAALRRYLVDEGLLHRDGGVYVRP